MKGLRGAGISLGAGVAILALAAWAIGRSPALPYNVRELFPAHPLATGLGLAAVVYWVLGAPFVLAAWLARGRATRILLYPVAVVLHGAIAWTALRLAVPMESLYDIVGSPVLHWPWEWEMLGRFIALMGGVIVLWTGAAALATALWTKGVTYVRALARWGIGAAALLPLAHFIVVTRAATDNLTELMAGGGGPAASVALGAGIFALGFSASSVALLAAGRARRVLMAAAAALVSFPLGYAAFQLGLERHVEKYGQVFSAFQFLLSRDRTSYAGNAELLVRYAVAHAAAVFLGALAQHPAALVHAEGDRSPGATPPLREPESG